MKQCKKNIAKALKRVNNTIIMQSVCIVVLIAALAFILIRSLYV